MKALAEAMKLLTEYRDEGSSFLKPSQKVDIDVYVSDKETFAIEVKSFVEDMM